MNGANTLDMTLYDYQASLHHWVKAHADGPDLEPPSVDEVEAMFARGVGTVQ